MSPGTRGRPIPHAGALSPCPPAARPTADQPLPEMTSSRTAIHALRLLFIAILAVMLWGTVRASLAQALFDIPSDVIGNPWFQVTLFDAYFAFLTFYVWVAWKEQSTGARVLWFLAIMLWGNFAMATYMLVQLFRTPTDAPLAHIFTTREPGHLTLPATFTALGVVIYLLGAKNVLF